MVTIGITDNHENDAKYGLYVDWIMEGDAGVSCLRLTHRDGNAGLLDRCDALVLSGGGDVDPGLYGGQAGHPTLSGVQPERDAFESGLASRAFGLGMPLLGICRGMQLVNVLLGGTLIVDLEEAGYPSHRSAPGGRNAHEVRLRKESALGKYAAPGPVASSHHQAVGRIGGTLAVAGVSADGVVEALEKANEDGTIAALLVQWHPERMRGMDPALSDGVREFFFTMIRTHIPSNQGTRQ